MRIKQQLGYRFGRLTERLPHPAHVALWRVLRLMKPPELVRLSGTTHAGTRGTMIVAGMVERDFVAGKYFAGEPERTGLGRVPIWGLARRLRTLRESANLTVAVLDRAWAARLPGEDYLLAPEWVCLVTDAVQSVRDNPNSTPSLLRDHRRLRSEKFEYVVSHEAADGRAFFDEMVEPHVSARHSDAQLSLAALQHALRRGALLWIMQEGQRVAGMLVERRAERLWLRNVGVAGGDPTLLRRGVLAAAYIHAVEYGAKLGCRSVDLGGSRPWLSDGVLRYKVKWRPRLEPRWVSPFGIFLRWPDRDPGVAAMLQAHPLISRRGDAFSWVTPGAAWPPTTVELRSGEWPPAVAPGSSRLENMSA